MNSISEVSTHYKLYDTLKHGFFHVYRHKLKIQTFTNNICTYKTVIFGSCATMTFLLCYSCSRHLLNFNGAT